MYGYNYYPQQQMPITQGLKGRPVSSVEEVRAMPVDFDGSISYFPDVANKRIYTKQINLDGTASVQVYELMTVPVEKRESYITKEEVAKMLEDFKATMAKTTKAEKQVVEF